MGHMNQGLGTLDALRQLINDVSFPKYGNSTAFDQFPYGLFTSLGCLWMMNNPALCRSANPSLKMFLGHSG